MRRDLTGQTSTERIRLMRVAALFLLFVGCSSVPPVGEAQSDFSCEEAAAKDAPSAFERFEWLMSQSEVQAANLERSSLGLANGDSTVKAVDEDGERLGETLGEALVWCTCNEQLSITEECVVLMTEMDWAFE